MPYMLSNYLKEESFMKTKNRLPLFKTRTIASMKISVIPCPKTPVAGGLNTLNMCTFDLYDEFHSQGHFAANR